MSNDPPDGTLGEADSAVLAIVSAGLQAATVETAKKYGEHLLATLLPLAIGGLLAGPLATGAAAMLAAMIDAVFKKTGAVERKLNRMLAEPFKTARRTLSDVLSEEVRNDAEEAEAMRRIQRIIDQLESAHTYAEGELPAKRLLVRVYQCFAASFLEGGGAAMRNRLDELRAVATGARAKARLSSLEAESIKRRDAHVIQDAMLRWQQGARANFALSPLQRERPFPLGMTPPPATLDDILDAKERFHRDQAATLEFDAGNVEAFCSLIEVVHEHRRAILRSPKDKRPFAAVWQRLGALVQH